MSEQNKDLLYVLEFSFSAYKENKKSGTYWNIATLANAIGFNQVIMRKRLKEEYDPDENDWQVVFSGTYKECHETADTFFDINDPNKLEELRKKLPQCCPND